MAIHSGLIAAGRLGFDHALLDGLVDQAESLRKQLPGLIGFAFRDRDFELLDPCLELVTVDLVDKPPLLTLFVPLYRRCMVRHIYISASDVS